MTIALGNHHLLTIKAGERQRVRAFYTGILGCELHAHDHGVTANIPENVDIFHFVSGDVIGVAYADEGSPTVTDAQARLGCWLELMTWTPWSAG